MLGVSGLMGSSGDGAADGSGGSSEAGAASSSVPGGGVEESGGGGGGNRWPRQETLALIKIRSDMDVTFRESSLKGPLWEEVSRKMAELGYQRSAKKCKEKFENVFKYHKRTKDGRASKSDGKTYRFFDQLEALDNTTPPHFNPPPPPRLPATISAPPPPPTPVLQTTLSSSAPSPNPVSIAPPMAHVSTNHPPFQPSQLVAPPPPAPIPQMGNLPPASLVSDSTSTWSTSSDEDIQRRRGQKRKWKDFFERMMREVVRRQEELQAKFLQALEQRERDRAAREDAWRALESARLSREHDLFVQEHTATAARDAAVIAFLQKFTDTKNDNNNGNESVPPPPPPPAQLIQVPPPQNPQPPPPPPPTQVLPQVQPSTLPLRPKSAPTPLALVPAATPTKIQSENSGGGESSMAGSSSRWPKAEVQALINLRTSLDLKYQDNGPKGPLWEEISTAMAKLGYNRSSKRCKEKWENINKYFKKVKESNKKRPEDSKTCPYFHQLDALYKEKARNNAVPFTFSLENQENLIAPIMARPEQQWPLPSREPQQHQDSSMADHESDNNGIHEEDEEEEEEDDDDDDEGGGFEMAAANKQAGSTARNAADRGGGA